jgi:hypothetical protein
LVITKVSYGQVKHLSDWKAEIKQYKDLLEKIDGEWMKNLTGERYKELFILPLEFLETEPASNQNSDQRSLLVVAPNGQNTESVTPTTGLKRKATDDHVSSKRGRMK